MNTQPEQIPESNLITQLVTLGYEKAVIRKDSYIGYLSVEV